MAGVENLLLFNLCKRLGVNSEQHCLAKRGNVPVDEPLVQYNGNQQHHCRHKSVTKEQRDRVDVRKLISVIATSWSEVTIVMHPALTVLTEFP